MRYKRPYHKNALSLVECAEKEMNFTLSLKPTKESGSTIVRNIYECFRRLGNSLLISKGIKSEDHILPIKELMSLEYVKTTRPIKVVDNLGRLRHNINYHGYSPGLVEVEDTLSIAKSLFKPLLNEVKKIISKH